MTHEDPRIPLREARAIIDAADGRDMTAAERERCEALLDAAEALGRIARLDAAHAAAVTACQMVAEPR